MRGRIFSVTIVVVLVLGMFVGVDIGLEVVEIAEGTTIYVPNDYSTIQEAIDAANDGDTVYVYRGVYTENVIVGKSVNLIGENRDNTIIQGLDYCPVVKITADRVYFFGFTIRWSSVGIELRGSSHTNIIDNTIDSIDWYGILLGSSSFNNISDNSVHSNYHHGIYLESSSNNSITGNKIFNNGINPFSCSLKDCSLILCGSSNNIIMNNSFSNNDDGIGISSSSNTIVSNNIFSNNGICIFGNQLSHFNSHFISTDNLVNGKPLYYYKDCSNVNIDGLPVGQIILVNCTDFNIKNLQLNNTFIGIEVAYSRNNNITSNNMFENMEGIYLISSSHNNILDNNIQSNYDFGVFLESSSNNNILTNNIQSNKLGGLCLISSSLNNIIGNNISLTQFNYCMEFFYWSSNNKIYHNNIINNAHQVGDDSGFNYWDNGYPSGGNYWSNYRGVDNYKGPNQDIQGSDGIGDTPCIIDWNSRDNYPLMNPWSAPTTLNYPPVVNASSDVTALESDNITFHANASDANGDPLTYDWNFGDGSTSSLANPSHIYQDNGLYEVSLTVTDDSGASTNASILVNILNVPPIASAGPDITVNEGDSVLLSASATDASPVDILSYNWDPNNDGIFDDAVGQNVNWTWYDDCQFNVGVNVSDDDGGSDYAYILVTVNNVAPSVSISITSSIIDKKETVTIYGNYSDPGADTHTFLWDFGDGIFSNESIPNHIYTQDGDYTITFMVTDDDGGTGFDSLNVTVVNTPPTIEKIYATVETKEEKISSNYNNTNVINSDSPEVNSSNSSNDLIVTHGNNDKTPGEQDTEISPIIGPPVIEDENDSPALDRIAPQSVYVNQRCFLFVKADDSDEDEVLTFSDDSDLVEIDPVFGVITFIPDNGDIGYHFINITVTDSQGEEDTRLMALKIEEPPTIIRESRKEESPFPLPLLLIPVIVIFIVIVLMHDFVVKKRAKAKRKKKPKLVPMKVTTHPKKQPQLMTIKRAVSPPTYNVMYAAGPSELGPLMSINSELDVVIEYPWEVTL